MRPVVLVADDDAAVRFVMEVALRREGLQVLTARDGAECMSMAASGAPDVILLDLRMPVVNGLEVLRKRAGWDPAQRIPVIVISGSDDTSNLNSEQIDSVAGIFHKPFDLADLIDLIKETIDKTIPGGTANGGQSKTESP